MLNFLRYAHVDVLQINYTEERYETKLAGPKDIDKYSFANMYPGLLHKEAVVNYSLKQFDQRVPDVSVCFYMWGVCVCIEIVSMSNFEDLCSA